MGRGQLVNVDSTVKRTFVAANRARYLKNTELWPLLLRLLESGQKNSKIACSRHASHFCVAPGGIRFDLRDPRGTQRSKSSYTTWICLYLPEYMPCFESPSRETWRWHGWISVHARALHRHTTRHVTSCTHFDWIFELMRSLRCNYALYRDTMPLRTNVKPRNLQELKDGIKEFWLTLTPAQFARSM